MKFLWLSLFTEDTFYNQSLFYVSKVYYPQKDPDFTEGAGPTHLVPTQATIWTTYSKIKQSLSFFQEGLSRTTPRDVAFSIPQHFRLYDIYMEEVQGICIEESQSHNAVKNKCPLFIIFSWLKLYFYNSVNSILSIWSRPAAHLDMYWTSLVWIKLKPWICITRSDQQ